MATLLDAEETRYFTIATYPFPSYVADYMESNMRSSLKFADYTFLRSAVIITEMPFY
jgi:hypothetical protein